jgi:DNA (cytosine-5)-methyltransferase 3A
MHFYNIVIKDLKINSNLQTKIINMNVISLFNGMGTLRQAFSDMNININKYYSSEIKPYAIELQQHHFPGVIQVGNIEKWKEWDIDWKTIDFIGSGSPCQDLSIAGKQKGVIKGKRSNLFFTFIEILEHVKSLNPNVKFLQENVGSAPKEDVGIMSRALGVYPVRINSKLVTAQLRDRYYWTNIRTKETMFDLVSDIPQPIDKKIMFKDIITDGFTDKNKSQALLMSEAKSFGYKDMNKFTELIKRRKEDGRQLPNMIFVNKEKANCILESESRPHQNQESLVKRNGKGFTNIVYVEKDEVRVKTNTKKGFDIMTEDDCLNLSFPTSTTRKGRVTKGKSPFLLQGNEPLYTLKNYNVRILNKTELCRLQGFPDDYCDILTRNKAASLLGDGWSLPVIIHILSFI